MNIKFKNKKRSVSETLTMLKNQMLVRLGFILTNKYGNLVMRYNGEQLRSNPKRKRLYSLDDSSWSIHSHSWFMSDDTILTFLNKRGR